MLDEKDLQAIAQLVGVKISEVVGESEARMTARFDDKLGRAVQELDGRIKDTESRALAYIEADILPKFDILAEGHQTLRQTLAPKDRVEALEDEIAFMKQVIKSMSQDIQALKKAQ